jgi:signal transduction histidine kinase
VFIILVSIGVGLWLAVSIIAPVTRLAHQVSQADPSGLKLSLDKLAREDEVGDLARAFMRYMSRVREFVAREKFFTADVSHELRTPLTIISGAVEVLEQDGALSEKQKERLNRIKYAARDMRGLTEGLMLMSREYQPGVESVSCNVSKIVQGSVDKHLHLIENRPVRVQFELIDQPYLNVERPLLEIVIGNLLRNAFFNTTTGAVTLRLEADRLVLTDTGSGMSPEVLARVFERYFKGATSAGAGVGLSLVNRICDRYGWRISIDSQQGKGTTVEVYFGEGAKAFH